MAVTGFTAPAVVIIKESVTLLLPPYVAVTVAVRGVEKELEAVPLK